MLKRIFILIIFVTVISAASAFDSTIIKVRASVNEVAVVKLASDTVGIKDELEDKSLKQILADVIKLKEGKIGEILPLPQGEAFPDCKSFILNPFSC